MAKRSFLDSGDASAFCAAVEAIATLTELARQLKAEAYLGRRRKRAEVQRLAEIHANDRDLQSRLRELDKGFPLAA
jgi:hypothetical protein